MSAAPAPAAAKPAAAAAAAAAPKAAAPAKAAAAPAPTATGDKKDEKKAAKKAVGKKAPAPKKVPPKKWTIDCSEPVGDDIFDIAAFEKFLKEKIKVAGKAGALGESVTVTRDPTLISVTAKIAFSKRYLKYLTKKFLKQQQLRDYIRVIARAKGGYFLRYFNFAQDENEGEAADA